MSKKANLSSLFPCGDNLVCIIDDRSDVWNFAPNVVQVMPYHFFQHTGDINAPPGLQKKENDNSSRGYDFSNLKDFSPNKDKEKYSEEEEDKEQKDTVSDENEGKTSEKVESDLHLEEKEKSSSEKCNAEDMGTNIKSDLHLEEEEKSRSEKCNAEDMGTNIKSDLHLEEEEKSKSEKCNAENMGTDIKELQEASEFEKGTETDDPDDITAIKTDVVPKETKENNDPCDKETIQNDSCHKETNKYDDPEDSAAVKNTDSDTLDVDDDDDYLLYLEDILKRLHAIFYKDYDQKLKMNKEELPDLKEIVPDSRKKVLSGCHLVLSCVVPQNTALIDSKVYHIATSLGATVSSKIIAKAKGKDHPDLNYTTHVVAANQHTEKVHQAKRLKNIKIVTPNWLWCCAERWEHVDERLFELTDEVEKTVIRNPPMHFYHKPAVNVEKKEEEENVFRSLNPLAFMSDDETKSMENEVDDILSEEGDESQDHNVQDNESSNSEEDSFIENNTNEFIEEDDEDYGNKKKRKLTLEDDFDDDEVEEEEEEEELPSIRFRQGGYLSSEENGSDSGDDDDMNAYGDILERELMGD
ncbi:RNA polymerase II subunit A C-terminal domain phosphatase [Armadillidium nasatum]|uniref:RNA polymerase II subunit A C-terminal domain phosphatase n=1 Tax=Armadillidium nasatum TaxID=96803 RepID=A0A5N5T9X8_9CRUS|nr:RNA polymerase II subunit A C-terminal domain phosphatase [Armadillidium nasatum]